MKNLFNNKFKLLLITVLSFILIALSLAIILPSAKTHAEEENSINSEFHLPKTTLEYKGLSSPIDVYYSEDLTVVAQSDKIFVYRNGKYEDTSTLSFTSLKQVKRLSENLLLINDFGIIYSIDLTTMTKTGLCDSVGDPISGNYFDLNKDYLVTAFGQSALIYKISQETFTKTDSTYTVRQDLPIAINQNNKVFFVDNTGISMITAGTTSSKSDVYNASPSKMIANNQYVYYIENSKIIRIDISDNSKYDLAFSDIDSDYDLGSEIAAPTGIAFKGENLLITNASAVQEFKIQEGQLVFTGFAIARNRSAFNRIGTDATNVEKYGNTVAVLDEFKLTVFYNTGNEYYGRDNFDNFLSNDLGGEMPSSFALGEKSIMLVYRQNTSSSSLRFLTLADGKVSESGITVFTGNIMLDACYQSGYYYLLVSDGSSPSVYKFNETDFACEKIENLSLLSGFSKISVDVFQNIYFADESAIYKCTKSNAYQHSSLISILGVKKIANDLSGRIFALTSEGLGYINNGNFIKVYAPSLTTSPITSFAMDFISDEIYFIYQGEQLLSSATGLNNLAISSITAPDTYKTTDDNSIGIDELKIYTPNEDANVYSVKQENKKFTFNYLITQASEYVFICDIQVTPQFTITALAGQQGIVLINKTEINEKELVKTDAPGTVYITTSVHMYYLPIITKYSEFAISTEGNGIRLAKSTMILPETTFTFLGREYYYASVTINGITHKGYVPTAFTVEVLSENFVWEEFTLAKVNKGSVFADEQLTDKLFDLTEGQNISIIKSQNGIAQIAIEKEDGSISIGYIDSELIQNPSSDAIKLVIIIVAVGICILITGLFLILRKRK